MLVPVTQMLIRKLRRQLLCFFHVALIFQYSNIGGHVSPQLSILYHTKQCLSLYFLSLFLKVRVIQFLYKNSLSRLLAAPNHVIACLQHVLWMSDSPTPLSSLLNLHITHVSCPWYSRHPSIELHFCDLNSLLHPRGDCPKFSAIYEYRCYIKFCQVSFAISVLLPISVPYFSAMTLPRYL